MIKKIFKNKSAALKKFDEDYKNFTRLDVSKRFDTKWEDRFPCLKDNTKTTVFDAHYVYHPAWAARIVKEINPPVHVDISSTLHFCTILSAFIPVDFYDYRPAILTLPHLQSKHADLTNLSFASNSIHSLSCMHTVEHIGLGRYGDPIDPDGDIKAINELKRVCAIDGNIIFVTPVGKPKIMFNAHRIYSPEMIINYFEGFTLKEFSLVTDDRSFTKNAPLQLGAEQKYGCGCFWFEKNRDDNYTA